MSLEYLKIIRPFNGIAAAAAVWIGSLIAGGLLTPSLALILGMISVFLISGGGAVVNDFFDVEIDKLNRPNRQIASGKISRRIALVYSGILFVIGCTAAYFINFDTLIVGVLASALLIAYAAQLKKTILVGNIVISGLIALTFIFGGLILGNYTALLPLALFIFLSNTGRELYKAIDDAIGDHKYNVNSLAIKLGVVNARIIANIFLVVAVIFSFIPYFLKILGPVYMFFAVLGDIIFLSAAVAPVKYGSRLRKIAMLIAIAAFFIGAYSMRIVI